MMINQSSARPGFTNITSCPGEGARGNQETPESAVKTYAGHCGHPEELCCDSGPPKKKNGRGPPKGISTGIGGDRLKEIN